MLEAYFHSALFKFLPAWSSMLLFPESGYLYRD
jgi:hypothetical protein